MFSAESDRLMCDLRMLLPFLTDDAIVEGALRLLGMTIAIHNLHGVLKPVGDPRDYEEMPF